jgi:hypothetical protein
MLVMVVPPTLMQLFLDMLDFLADMLKLLFDVFILNVFLVFVIHLVPPVQGRRCSVPIKGRNIAIHRGMLGSG